MSDLAPTSASRVARPSLLMRAEKVPNEVAEARPGPLALLGTAVWFGLIAGPLELGLVLVRDRITDEVTPASLQTSRHALWMIPVSDLLIFAACGLLLALAARLAPGSAPGSACSSSPSSPPWACSWRSRDCIRSRRCSSPAGSPTAPPA